MCQLWFGPALPFGWLWRWQLYERQAGTGLARMAVANHVSDASCVDDCLARLALRFFPSLEATVSNYPGSKGQSDRPVAYLDGTPSTVEQKVRVRAYQLYEYHRGVDGRAEQDWLEAEAQVLGIKPSW